MKARGTATLAMTATIAANASFALLGTAFGYPDVLADPPGDALAAFRAHQPAVMLGFGGLAAASALLAPVAWGLGRQAGSAARWIVGLGIAAAVVQVIGLSRWLWLVPTLAWQATSPEHVASASAAYESAGLWLGTVLGETFGYLLTGAWTVAVVIAFRRDAPAWSLLGGLAAAAILTGVLVPLGVPGADLTNFVGYVVWSIWLVWLAIRLWSSL